MTPTSYAIGDIHGRLDLLVGALEAIERHARGRSPRIIFLGDYVDRGPDSRRVIERLMTMQAEGDAVCLKGNHEELMILALTDARPTVMNRWRRYGGDETLMSYGVGEDDDPVALIPREHVRWMTGLPLTTADPHRIYVHAGLSPNTVFHQQTEAACLWIRGPFLRAPGDAFDAHVVHGHTPVWEGKPEGSEPELLAHRTNLDTAAFASGVLTVGVFDEATPGGPVELITVRGEPGPFAMAMETVDDAKAEPDAAPARRRGWARLGGRRA